MVCTGTPLSWPARGCAGPAAPNNASRTLGSTRCAETGDRSTARQTARGSVQSPGPPPRGRTALRRVRPRGARACCCARTPPVPTDTPRRGEEGASKISIYCHRNQQRNPHISRAPNTREVTGEPVGRREERERKPDPSWGHASRVGAPGRAGRGFLS